jgi:phosphatidylethanolamine/phosphatidyl-N-methylethanolamine N-methyltransferase
MSPTSRFVAIEINPELAAIFRAAHPGVTLIEDSVEHARAICDSLEVQMVDCIISGLPWALFSKSMQVRILDEMMRVLKPGGTCVTFGYVQSLALPAARHFAALLPTYFTSVSKSPVVWLNVPPAFVYSCRR